MKIEIIQDELDESLAVEEREKARLWREEEMNKVGKMSKKEFKEYVKKCNREVVEEEL
jgi:hypothetical protein